MKSLGGKATDFRPTSWVAVTHDIRRAGRGISQREQAQFGNVFHVDQVDVFVGIFDFPPPDPIEHVSSWSVEPGQSQNHRSKRGA